MKTVPFFKLLPEPQTEEAKSLKSFQWAGEDIGKRHQLGGAPVGITEADFPRCPECGKVMSFYGQFDSINDDYIIADCGTIAVFYCFDCIEVKAVITSG